MLQSNRRGTFVLYLIFALSTFIAFASGAPALFAALLVAFAVFVALTARPVALPRPNFGTNARNQPPRITRAGQRAAENAPQTLSILGGAYLLQDIGLVIDERQRGGLSLRQARFMSLDDESVRPYVVIHNPDSHYPRRVLLRFEMIDAGGQPQFVYEMESVLHDGENLLLPDYRLPLKNNDKITHPGGWELRFSVDDFVLGVHQFSLMPSMQDRLRNTTDGEVSTDTRLIMEEKDEQLPVSLEELLSSNSNA